MMLLTPLLLAAPGAAAPSPCETAASKLCSDAKAKGVKPCMGCAGHHAVELVAANCTDGLLGAFCGAPCEGELLYNGICLPSEWPPRWPTAGGLPPHDGSASGPQVPYIQARPARINVSLGRQLFVDTFLIESMPGLQLMSHAAKWEEQVMQATEPWEATHEVPVQD